jgi:hypothetical protein
MRMFRLSESGRQFIKLAKAPTVKQYGDKILDYVVSAESVLEEERRHIASITNGGKSLSDEFKRKFEAEYSQLMRTLEFSHTLADLMANGDEETWAQAKEQGIKRKKFDGERRGAFDYDGDGIPDTPAMTEDPQSPVTSPESEKTEPLGDDLSAPVPSYDPNASPSDRPDPSLSTENRPVPKLKGDQGLKTVRSPRGRYISPRTILLLDEKSINNALSGEARLMEETSFSNLMKSSDLASLISAAAISIAGGSVLPKQLIAKELTSVGAVEFGEDGSYDMKELLSVANEAQGVLYDTLEKNGGNFATVKNIIAEIGEYVTAGKNVDKSTGKSLYAALRSRVNPATAADKFKFVKMADAQSFEIEKYRDRIQDHYNTFVQETSETIELQKSFVYYVDMMAKVVKRAYDAVNASVAEDQDSPYVPVLDGLKWMGRLVQNMKARGDSAVDDWEKVKESGLTKMTAEEMAELVDENDDGFVTVDEFFTAATDIAVDGHIDEVALTDDISEAEEYPGETSGESSVEETSVTEEPSTPPIDRMKEEGTFNVLISLGKAAYTGDGNPDKEAIVKFAQAILNSRDTYAAKLIANDVVGLGSGQHSLANEDSFFMQMNQHAKYAIDREDDLRDKLNRFIEYKEENPEEGAAPEDVRFADDDFAYLEKEVANAIAVAEKNKEQLPEEPSPEPIAEESVSEDVVEEISEKQRYVNNALQGLNDISTYIGNIGNSGSLEFMLTEEFYSLLRSIYRVDKNLVQAAASGDVDAAKQVINNIYNKIEDGDEEFIGMGLAILAKGGSSHYPSTIKGVIERGISTQQDASAADGGETSTSQEQGE